MIKEYSIHIYFENGKYYAEGGSSDNEEFMGVPVSTENYNKLKSVLESVDKTLGVSEMELLGAEISFSKDNSSYFLTVCLFGDNYAEKVKITKENFTQLVKLWNKMEE